MMGLDLVAGVVEGISYNDAGILADFLRRNNLLSNNFNAPAATGDRQDRVDSVSPRH